MFRSLEGLLWSICLAAPVPGCGAKGDGHTDFSSMFRSRAASFSFVFLPYNESVIVDIVSHLHHESIFCITA